jgi:DNA invertase Pin-like site-specific DNA recombinase
MMGSVAEFERSLINRKIYEGVKRAQELGKYKGRTHPADKTIRGKYVKMMKSGNYPVSYMAKVSRQNLYNWQADLSN